MPSSANANVVVKKLILMIELKMLSLLFGKYIVQEN